MPSLPTIKREDEAAAARAPHDGSFVAPGTQVRANPLAEYAMQLGDDALILGQRVGEWCGHAPALEVDLSLHAAAWEQVPGGPTNDMPDPSRERVEQILMGTLTLGSVALFLWLVVPGRDIKGNAAQREPRKGFTPATSWVPRTPPTAYPVLGEVLPEAPVNAEGIFVSLRAMDACLARITGEGVELSHPIHVSEPWTLRVKGPFVLTLENAGVVTIEVAGHRINHGSAVGEPWSGRFDEAGRWILPVEVPSQLPLFVPQTDPETSAEE